MKNRRKLQSVLSIVLVLVLVITSFVTLTGAGRSQPDNPIGRRDERLHAETMTGSSSLWGQSGGNIGEDGSGETPDTTEETPPEEEPETPPDKEPETPPEPEQPPKTDETPETPTEPEQPSDPDQPSEPDQPSAPDQPTDPDAPTDPDTPDDGKDDNGGGKEPSGDDGGNSPTEDPGKGDAGNDGDGGSSGGDKGESGDEDDTPRIYTDLYNNMYFSKSDLPDGKLTFLAYPLGKGEDLSVKVVLQNSSTSGNGKVLTSTDGKHYIADLVFNEASYVTIYLREKGENIAYVRYKINYHADKANEENPEVGDYPPTIITSLDGAEETDFTTRNLTFWVRATTHPELGGKTIYSNQIQVWLDGELLTKQSGDARPEYDIEFPLPNIEGTVQHTIKVLAWDSNGNSTYKYYNVTYSYRPEGVRNGEVTVVLDATAAGLGIMARGNVDILSGDTVASAVLDFLQLYGYSPVYDGTETNAFYLRSISSSNIGKYSFIPAKLQEMLERDGATFTGRPKRDSLGEFDYTRGSGWMYAIDGEVYPGRSMSLYPAQPGMTIYLRFTLAYGKDIGGFFEDGSSYGALTSYCRLWINNNFNGQEVSHRYEETNRVEPTATENGYIEYTCVRCHDTMQEVLPATGEEPGPTDPTEPTDPDKPTEPTDPDQPTEPTDPDKPTEPTEPDNPTEPTDPDKPTEPTDPDKPTEPSEPETPDQGDTGGTTDLENGGE